MLSRMSEQTLYSPIWPELEPAGAEQVATMLEACMAALDRLGLGLTAADVSLGHDRFVAAYRHLLRASSQEV